MRKSQLLNSTLLTVLICIKSINGKTEFDVFRLKTPANYDFGLMEWITAHPGVDVFKFNSKEINIAIPKQYSQSFWKFGVTENGTDFLERKLINNHFYYRRNPFTETSTIKANIELTAIPDNGVWKIRQRRKDRMHIDYSRRPSYHKVVHFLENLAQQFPEKLKLQKLGKTVNNQNILMATVSARKTNYKNGIFLHAGIQGNEWISVLVVLYLIQEMVENSHSYPIISHLTWYVIPVVNPDGYRHAYVHRKKNMPHHKNRNCSQTCDLGECGVNIFRNFPWNFQGKGSSRHPCSSFYAGNKPFSEIESKVFGQALEYNSQHLKMYVGIHGHQGAVLYPWGYDRAPCDDYKELEQLARIAADAMNIADKNVTNYTIGNLGTESFPSAGNPLDYAKHNLQIKYAFILHMRKASSNYGRFTFELEEVLPLIKETFAGIKAMATEIYSKYPPPKKSLRLKKRKRKLLQVKNIGCIIKLASVSITWHLITTLVR